MTIDCEKECRGSALPLDDKLTLHVPRVEELWYYQQQLSDPATMAYNAAWFPPDGCIRFPEEKWAAWHESWIGREPERFFAYLRRETDGAFVGWAHYRWFPPRDWWDIGILVAASERGKGYGRQGLELLLDRAFRVDGVPRLHNCFEAERTAAMRIHREAGFREIGEEDGGIQLLLEKEEYLRSR